MRLQRSVLLSAFVMLVLGCAAVKAVAQEARQALSADSVIEQIKKRGSIKVGLSTFVPWAMPDKNGELIGFEVDVAKRLAEDMGVKLDIVPTSWDGIIPALISGKFDVIIGGMTVTPARNLTVNFTQPYEYTEQHILVNKKLVPDIKALEDLNKPSIVIANRRGATTATLAKKLFPKATHLLFDDENQSLQEVLNGKAQAIMAATPTPSLWLEKYPDVLAMPLAEPLRKEPESFAVRKGDPDAINYFNNWILVRTADGWLKERFDYWFNSRAWSDRVASE